MIDGPAPRKVACDATVASVVPLKNSGGLLPLTQAAKVVIIGPWVNPLLHIHGRKEPMLYIYAVECDDSLH